MLRHGLGALTRIGLALGGRLVSGARLLFNAATVTFTPSMAKRLPPAGPFAVAVLVQVLGVEQWQ